MFWLYIYTEPNGTLITNVSVISERHCFHTRTIIIYNIINIYKFVLVSSFLHVIFLELPLEIYNFKFPRSGKSSIISRITIKLGYDSKMSKTFLCPSIYSTVLTMTIGAQQLLCYNSDTVAASYSKMFGSKLHCIYIYIYMYKFQNRTRPQFYSKHFYTDCTFCFYTNTIARSRSHPLTMCLNIYTRIKCPLPEISLRTPLERQK